MTGSSLSDVRLSVLTPVLNGGKSIRGALDSVLEQRFKSLEHLVLDGGSTDGTLDIVQAYAARYPHIHLISGPDRGQSDALNKGLLRARGDVIGVLNADDFYSPGAVQSAMHALSTVARPAFVVGLCNILDEAGAVREVNRPARLALRDLLLGLHVNAHPANPSAYFYDKQVHELVGPYRTEDHYSMDLDFILRAVQVAHCAFIDELWGNFRLVPGTKTYEDVQGGRLTARCEVVYRRYEKDLPSPIDRHSIRWVRKACRLAFKAKRAGRSLVSR